jgi:alanine-glyoxylate transaminase/serine-glyoxylate transaminase/serine-pyruvate transaminase
VEEGLEARWQRHLRHGRALQSGLEAMGLTLHADAGHRLPVLTTVRIPEGVDDAALRRQLLDEYNMEIGGGLGPLRGRVWRIGLMGYGSAAEHVLFALSTLERVLMERGVAIPPGAGLTAAQAALAE